MQAKVFVFVVIATIFDKMKNIPGMMKHIFFFILVTMLLSCSRDPLKVDISKISTDIGIVRFEQDLFTSDPSSVAGNLEHWQSRYGDFFDYFCFIAGIGSPENPGFMERLTAFISDKNNYLLYKKTMEVFPDTDALEQDLNNAFRHYLYYFPGKQVPRVFTYVSGIRQSVITDEGLLGIGLDKYLGSNQTVYRQAGIYNYMLKNMHPGKIVSDCMTAWGETEFAFNDSVDNLISRMVYRGMLAYFSSAMLPDQPDSLITGFKTKEIDYLIAHEASMWAFLIEHKLLFETNKFTMDKYILEGPFTTDFGRNSPARAAVWIGYRIVESYMKKNSDVTLQQLMEERNYQKILTMSRYNPR